MTSATNKALSVATTAAVDVMQVRVAQGAKALLDAARAPSLDGRVGALMQAATELEHAAQLARSSCALLLNVRTRD